MVDAIPGAYLYRTRIGSDRALLSFAWLELLPMAAGVATAGLAQSLLVIGCHFGVLGLYELGYMHNDVAKTAAETARPQTSDGRGAAWLQVPLVVPRVALWFMLVAVTAWISGPGPAAAYAVGAWAVVALLAAHTAWGERVPAQDPRRWIVFSWLAWGKYLPALLAATTVDAALALSLVLFACYGAGRVTEYAILKHAGRLNWGALDPQASWYLASLPLTALACTALQPEGACLAAAALTVGAHAAVASGARLLQRRRS